MEAICTDLITAAWMVAVLIGIALLIAGARKKVVIYYDAADLGVSLLSIVLLFSGCIVQGTQPFLSPIFSWIWEWGVSSLLYAAGSYCVFINFYNAIRYNRSVWLGLFVGVFKIAFLLLSALVVYFMLGGKRDDEDQQPSIENILIKILIVMGLIALARAMINGPEVYKGKKWRLPQRKQVAQFNL